MQAAAWRMTDYSSENARICQFEVPGGGECRDTTCGDIHLSQLQVEPNGAPHPLTLCLYPAMSSSYRFGGGGLVSGCVFTDEEIAQYLCGDQNVAQLVQALQAARTRRPEATFDERVKEVWTRMRGIRTQVTFDDKT
jgi:hypothetical protein